MVGVGVGGVGVIFGVGADVGVDGVVVLMFGGVLLYMMSQRGKAACSDV